MATEQARRPNFGSDLGFKIEEWGDGLGRTSLLLEPRHLNISGVVHGGALMTLLDVTTNMTGIFCTVKGNRRYSVTVSLNVNFVGQARTGRLIATARLTGGGGRIYFTAGEVRSEDGALVASATGVHRYRNGSEKPEGVPKKV